MRTAIDSSVLLAILNGEPGHDAWSRVLSKAASEGELVICPVVFAEVCPRFSSADEFLNLLELQHIHYDPISAKASFYAGTIFKDYRKAGGPREFLIPDFLIAAHAQMQCQRLAAIDRGYVRMYFPGLTVLPP